MNYSQNMLRAGTTLYKIFLLFLIINLSFNYTQAKESKSFAISNLQTNDSIYIITNREIDTTLDVLSFNHKIEQHSSLSFVKVFLNHSLELESDTLDYDNFIGEVCSKKSDWLLFVHGDGKTYKESVQRGLDIQNTYNMNVIVFSWPSEVPDINGLKNFKNSVNNVSKSMGHFNEVLSFMKDFKEKSVAFKDGAGLSMFLHSLGNLYLKELVDSTERNPMNYVIFDNIIMNSAAVNRENHAEWVEKLNFQKRIFITNNKYDFSLKGLHLYTKHGNQLGEEFNGAMAENANYIHFTEAIGFQTPTSNTHTYFIGDIPRQSKNIKRFYYEVFRGKQIDLSDSSRFAKRKEGLGYDVVF